MKQIIIGQRYMSIAEPELGLGVITEIEDKNLQVSYPATNEVRRYGMKTAPLKRIRFDIGDDVESNEGISFSVKEVMTSESGLLVYIGDLSIDENQLILECDLLDSINFHRPEEKLLNALPDKFSLFQLRYDTYKHRVWLEENHLKGLIGPRISLIEHQYYLAETICERPYPRVLLADEVGLGKTIEAGLITHKLICTGRIERVLIITPNTLNFQWYLEMQRKYNLTFSLVNEQTEHDPNVNPFDENNLVISSLEFLSGDESSFKQANMANWDLLIVDEAHKLQWSEDSVSPEYEIIETLAQKIKGLLLLTATPDIHGLEQHFSHLKLIDPERFQLFSTYQKEEKKFKEIADYCKTLIEEKSLTINDPEIKELVDCHGPGRIVFRNTRNVIDKQFKFFPKRILNQHPINSSAKKNINQADLYNTKLTWLCEHLQNHPSEKFLLICNSKEKVLNIKDDITKITSGNKIGVFHEDLSLMARDRQAAYFQDTAGANILLCSEIGSEGRNFQFCQNLILFDLPDSPDLLEQRIGRLDRIGQRDKINIHVPYCKGTDEEYLFTWYHEVFDVFSSPAKGATQIHQQYFKQYQNSFEGLELRQEIKTKAHEHFKKLNLELQQGRDVLIELNSFNKDIAASLISKVKKIDNSPVLKDYLERVYTHFVIDVEDLDQDSQYIKPGDNMFIPSFPYLDSEGFSYTFDRQTALEREELAFMSWDHPIVMGIMELIYGEEYGNVTLMSRKDKKVRPFIETFYLLETNAPKALEIGRFFPPTIIRLLIDLEGNNFSDKWDKSLLDEKLQDASAETIQNIAKLSKQKFKNLLKASKSLAQEKQPAIIENARHNAKTFYEQEISRLKALQKVNNVISDQEIMALEHKRDLIISHIDKPSLGMDSMRFIY